MNFNQWYRLFARVTALTVMLMPSGVLFGYSVLTHEEIVDLAWTSELRPLLLHRFPALTENQIREAHSYAYGGSVIQDLGYYPFGSRDFSDLLHYVRSGDFVIELLHQSQDANEYAFALGALSHYASDIDGHPAVNAAVALRYPKLRAKYGNSVRWAKCFRISAHSRQHPRVLCRSLDANRDPEEPSSLASRPDPTKRAEDCSSAADDQPISPLIAQS